MISPTPFQIDISDSLLEDLNFRLRRSRWPDEIPDSGWTFGANKGYLKELVDYWQTDFDWRAHESSLNRFDQFIVNVSGIELHFIHELGKGPKPIPLLLSHGWPGSFFEFNELIPMLTDPKSHGGDEKDSFTVVVPSLPGFNFSFKPDQKRFSAEDIADTFAQLMREVLGYEVFGAQGGDWGAFITTILAASRPEILHGIHLNFLPMARDLKLYRKSPSKNIQKYAKELEKFLKEETGYQWIQGTKPQTLSYALNDSPVGLAAWIIEKFFTWSDCKGDLDAYLGKDKLLTNIMLYWVTGSIGGSFWPYFARHHGTWPIAGDQQVDIPTGYIEFPKEILRPPREIAEEVFVDLQRWTTATRGGHFAAMENPELMAKELRVFFRQFRD